MQSQDGAVLPRPAPACAIEEPSSCRPAPRSCSRRLRLSEGAGAAPPLVLLLTASVVADLRLSEGAGAAPPLVLPAGEAVGVDCDPQKAMELLLLSSSCLPQL